MPLLRVHDVQGLHLDVEGAGWIARERALEVGRRVVVFRHPLDLDASRASVPQQAIGDGFGVDLERLPPSLLVDEFAGLGEAAEDVLDEALYDAVGRRLFLQRVKRRRIEVVEGIVP